MIVAAILLQVAAPAPAAAGPPADWSSIPPFPAPLLPVAGYDPSGYVQAEVKAGRCAAASAVDGVLTLETPVAVLVTAPASIRQVVPQAIGCPTVEQFTAGLVLTLARGALAERGVVRSGWYRLTITYRWPQ